MADAPAEPIVPADMDPSAVRALGPNPPATVKLFGWRLIAADAEAGTIEVAFDGKPDFGNPAGFVQGGVLIAMMDDAAGPIVVMHSKGRVFPSSIDIHAHFLRPVRFGEIRVKARVVQIGRSVGFMTAELYDCRGKLCATGSISAALTPGVIKPVAEAAA